MANEGGEHDGFASEACRAVAMAVVWARAAHADHAMRRTEAANAKWAYVAKLLSLPCVQGEVPEAEAAGLKKKILAYESQASSATRGSGSWSLSGSRMRRTPNSRSRLKKRRDEATFDDLKYPTPEMTMERQESCELPPDEFHRTIWLLKQLALTMNRGGYLSPKLYIHDETWYSGARIKSLQHKFTAMGSMIVILSKVEDAGGDFGNEKRLDQELESGLKELSKQQTTLAGQLKYISAPTNEKKGKKKASKTLRSAIASRAQVGTSVDDKGYVPLIKEVIEKTIVLEHVFDKYAPGSATPVASIVEKVIRMALSVRTILLEFAIRDFLTILVSYDTKLVTDFNASPLDVVLAKKDAA